MLLSVGYSSCHWCHVMAHESFEDPDTAAVMNELFVNVKVDREERPDALYMQATLALTGQGGWPMTPHPRRAPVLRRHLLSKDRPRRPPGFADLRRAIADSYRSRRDDVEGHAAEVARRLAAASDRSPAAEPLDRQLLEDAVVGLARAFDPVEGGFGGAPKFPLAGPGVPAAAARPPSEDHARQIVDLTLGKMAAGGIYDQVGGGFHRCSVDGQWLVPHFEKMLYDNALLARDYALAHRLARPCPHRPGDAGLPASRDAPAGRRLRCGAGRRLARRRGRLLRLDPRGDRGAAPRSGRARSSSVRGPAGGTGSRGGRSSASRRRSSRCPVKVGARPLLAAARRALYEARAQRPPGPRRQGDRRLERPGDRRVRRRRADPGSRRLHRRRRGDGAFALGRAGRRRAPAPGVHGRPRAASARRPRRSLPRPAEPLRRDVPPPLAGGRAGLAERMVELFADRDGGGFFSGRRREALVARTRDLEDHHARRQLAEAATMLLRLAGTAGDAALEERAGRGAGARARRDGALPQAFGTALIALDDHLAERREIAVVGRRRRARPSWWGLRGPARRRPRRAGRRGPRRPRRGRGRASWPTGRWWTRLRRPHVCVGFACRAPVTSPEELTQTLAA